VTVDGGPEDSANLKFKLKKLAALLLLSTRASFNDYNVNFKLKPRQPNLNADWNLQIDEIEATTTPDTMMSSLSRRVSAKRTPCILDSGVPETHATSVRTSNRSVLRSTIAADDQGSCLTRQLPACTMDR